MYFFLSFFFFFKKNCQTAGQAIRRQWTSIHLSNVSWYPTLRRLNRRHCTATVTIRSNQYRNGRTTSQYQRLPREIVSQSSSHRWCRMIRSWFQTFLFSFVFPSLIFSLPAIQFFRHVLRFFLVLTIVLNYILVELESSMLNIKKQIFYDIFKEENIRK